MNSENWATSKREYRFGGDYSIKSTKGVTHALTASIPCKPDLRQVRFEVQHEKINNPALLTEVRLFV